MTQYRLAKEIGVPQRRIGEIVAGKRAITADTAARLGVFFGMEAEFWLNLQAHCDPVHAREDDFTTVVKQDGAWWIGWVEEVPGVNEEAWTGIFPASGPGQGLAWFAGRRRQTYGRAQSQG